MPRKRQKTKEIEDKIAQMYLKGVKTIIIQMEYDVDPGMLYRILRERNIKPRRHSRSTLL